MKKVSLRRKLIRLFCMTSMIPILVLGFFSYYNISSTLKENTGELTSNSLKQIDDNLQIWMESYEDLLYQIYTDDDMVEWVDNINRNQDVSVAKNQMRRFIRGLLNSKEYIRSITVITENGDVITADQLTPVTYENAWIENFSMDSKELYDTVSADYHMHIFPTEYGTSFANGDYYFFHIAHRIVDYRDLGKRNGIVVVSLDEMLLRDVCQTSGDSGQQDTFNLIIDENGRVICYDDKEKIGTTVTDATQSLEERMEDYADFLEQDKGYSRQYTTVLVYEDEDLGWDIVNVTDQSGLMSKLESQLRLTVLLGVTVFAIAVILTVGLSGRLVASVQTVVETMKKTRTGDLSVRVAADEKMPLEVESIALEFNDMLEKLGQAQQKEKEANERQKEAEIVALEAQINPHFLYNTLDTINWMAIDRDEYDISNAIGALATILRYAIVNSNAEVTVRDELEWLKKYVYLQQFRLKNQFTCVIDADADVMEDRIHKLLLQPFVENAIIHGFEGKQSEACLKISVKEEQQRLAVYISDNGKGMEADMVEQFNREMFGKRQTGHHIGMENAITRLRMYYGEAGEIHIVSAPGEGATICIRIPLGTEEKTL